MRQSIIVIALLALLSCRSNEVPSRYIQPAAMEKIVWDMLLADEIAMQLRINDTSINLKQASFKEYDKVWAIHGVSRQHFYESYAHYQKHPVIFKQLILAVRKRADKEKSAHLPKQ